MPMVWAPSLTNGWVLAMRLDGATDTLLVLTQAEVGQTITVRVSYIDGGGTTETLTAAPTTTVTNINDAPTGLPIISGTDSRRLADPHGEYRRHS